MLPDGTYRQAFSLFIPENAYCANGGFGFKTVMDVRPLQPVNAPIDVMPSSITTSVIEQLDEIVKILSIAHSPLPVMVTDFRALKPKPDDVTVDMFGIVIEVMLVQP